MNRQRQNLRTTPNVMTTCRLVPLPENVVSVDASEGRREDNDDVVLLNCTAGVVSDGNVPGV